MDEAIAITLAIFRNSPQLDDKSVFRALVERGIERSLAAQIVEFLPSAYCRVFFLNSGAQFSNSFTRTESPRKIQSFSWLPVWVTFLAYAESEIRGGAGRHQLMMVAGRSAEFHAINQLLDKGSELKNVVLTPMSLQWPENGPDGDG
jgi:hypothetical protein